MRECGKKCGNAASCSGRCRALGRVGDLCRSGMASLEAGDGGVAERVLRHALEMTREFELGPVMEAKAANGLGLVLYSVGRQAEALREFRHALRLVDGRIGMENRLYRTVHRNYLRVLEDTSRRDAGSGPAPERRPKAKRAVAQEEAECRN